MKLESMALIKMGRFIFITDLIIIGKVIPLKANSSTIPTDKVEIANKINNPNSVFK